MVDSGTIYIDPHPLEPDGDNSVPDAWVYLKLYADDVGSLNGRTTKPEYTSRKPYCISNATTSSLWLEVSNAGILMSDLVVVEYEIIYCSFAGHGPADGFATTHAGEISSDPIDNIATAVSIPPGESIKWEIRIPDPGAAAWLENLYFRARVATLWGQKLPKDRWDFATDPRVTEFHLDVR